jgi:thymidylate kinase
LAVEGIHGCGKSTFVNILAESLRAQGIECTTLEWGETKVGKALIPYKKAHTLGPESMLLGELCDLRIAQDHCFGSLDTTESRCVIIGDRSYVTALTRAIVRGGDSDWAKQVVLGVQKPDQMLFLDTDPINCMNRRILSGRSWSGTVSGADFLDIQPDEERFLTYLNLLRDAYIKYLPPGVEFLSANTQTEIVHHVDRIREFMSKLVVT